jgi:uncharacterized protein (DUF58 family)
MTPLTAGTIGRVYLVVVLVLATLFSSFFQLGIAVVLLGIELYSFYKPLKAGLNLVLVVSSLVFAPLALEALAGIYAVLLIVPALFLLDESLQNLALTQGISFSKIGRSASNVLRALGAGFVLVFGVGILVWNFMLMFTGLLLLGYLGIIVSHTFRNVPRVSLEEDKSWSRVVVGNSESAKFNLNAKAKAPLLVSLRTIDNWINVEPANFLLKSKSETKVDLKFSPPLAGPSKIHIQACFIDPRGLIQTGQILEPLDLHIIPRAKYAAWLAGKFLEQTASGRGMATPISTASSILGKQGVEFFGSRIYQSADRLKDIDWRHSYMLGELIVKEFSGAQGQVGVIVADLTAKSADDADELAYNLVMSALTFATEGLPSGLAVYNSQGIVSFTQPMNPRETLKKALALTEKIVVIDVKERVLETPKIGGLKRSLGLLEQVQGDSAQRLGELLMFEVEANEAAAKLHPATLALAKAVEKITGSAVVTVVSSLGNDSGALSLALEQLREKGFSTVFVRDSRGKKS